jgi:Zn-dependent protease
VIDASQLPSTLILIGIFLLVAFPVHEFAHAFVAYRLGDGTAKMFGRLTLNPVVHFDPIGGTMLVLTMLVSKGAFGFGMAKPTPVNPMNLEGGRRGEAIVAAAGPLSNLALAAAAAIPLRYLLASDTLDLPLLIQVLAMFIQINLLLMIFNLIPIPPLDGSKVMFAFMDRRTEYQVRPVLEQYGLVILIFLILPILPGGSILGQVISPIIDGIVGVLVGV